MEIPIMIGSLKETWAYAEALGRSIFRGNKRLSSLVNQGLRAGLVLADALLGPQRDLALGRVAAEADVAAHVDR